MPTPGGEDGAACELKRLFVAAEARGQGIGAELVRTALERATHRGYRRAFLDTAPADMAQAHHLYQRFGFRPVASPPHPLTRGIAYFERSLP